VNGLNFSPDNSKLVSGSADKTIRVWDVAKGKVLCQTQTATEVNAVTWVADGRQIASGGADYLIRLWYVDVAKRELAALKEIKGHEGPVTSLATISAQWRAGHLRQRRRHHPPVEPRRWPIDSQNETWRRCRQWPCAPTANGLVSAGLNNIAKLGMLQRGKKSQN